MARAIKLGDGRLLPGGRQRVPTAIIKIWCLAQILGVRQRGAEHISIAARCNLACPRACPSFKLGGIRPRVGAIRATLEDAAAVARRRFGAVGLSSLQLLRSSKQKRQVSAKVARVFG